ncbi:MAG: kelch repeat-containing protein, partial [Phycisphaerae bacterium]|nr:kelch repeat-containing protein [Phycisphaerae bacterium]
TGSEKGIGKRTYAGMALDPERNKIVLFGDHYQSDPRTLVYDIAKDEWIDMKPKTSPPGDRSCPTMVYDSLNRVMICVTLGSRWDVDDWAAKIEAKSQKTIDDANAGKAEKDAAAAEKAFAATEKAKKFLETWTYDLGTNTWTKMDVQGGPNYCGTRDRLMLYIPEMNIVALECRGQEQQVWTYRYKLPLVMKKNPVLPPTPTDLKVVTEDGGKATVTCNGIAFSGRDVKIRIYRAEVGDQPWKAQFKSVHEARSGPITFADTGLEAGKNYCYYAASVEAGQEGTPTSKVRTQPRIVVDSRVDVLAKDKVAFSWKKSAEADVVGYVVERAVLLPISAAQKVSTAKQYGDNPIPLTAMAEKGLIGEWKRLTDKPIAAAEFTDSIDLTKPAELGTVYWRALFGARTKGGPATRPEDDKSFDMTKPGCPFTMFCYRVRAVNKLGVEGGPSPYQMTVPNEVDNLFTKEDGKDVQMKWQATPHAGTRGYLIYRLDTRYGPMSLLTPEPIKETTFTDKTAGGTGRRYYVVVVDAIGQQGIPTFEAWAFRDYSNIYSQFYPKDGWHQ